MKWLRLRFRNSWLRLGALGITVIPIVYVVSAITWRYAEPGPSQFIGRPPQLLVLGITVGTTLLLTAGMTWIARGEPGLHSGALVCLTLGITLAAVRLLAVSVGNVWTQTYEYQTGGHLDTETYVARARDVFTNHGFLEGGSVESFSLITGAIALGSVLVILVAISGPIHIAMWPRLASPTTRALGVARAVALVSGMCLLATVTTGAWMAAPTLQTWLTWGALLPIVAAVVIEARIERRVGIPNSAYLAAVTGSAALLSLAVLWLPLIYMLNASWPLQLSGLPPQQHGKGG